MNSCTVNSYGESCFASGWLVGVVGSSESDDDILENSLNIFAFTHYSGVVTLS